MLLISIVLYLEMEQQTAFLLHLLWEHGNLFRLTLDLAKNILAIVK